MTQSDNTVSVGDFDGDRAAAFGAQPPDELVLESTYLWGTFRSRGADSDIWTALRRQCDGASWPARLLLQSNAGANGIRKYQPAVHTIGQAARSVDAIEHGASACPAWHAPASEGAEPFDVAVSSTGIVWTEGALLALAGEEVTPGLQWRLPKGDDHEGMWYRSRIFQVAGTIDGVAVDGFVGYDEVHLPPGRQNYVDDPLTVSHLSEAWCTWATAYDDGSVEAGHVAFGRNGFGFGLRATGDAGSATTAVSGTVSRDDLGCPTHIAFDIDGDQWEFTADERGMPAQPLPGPVRQAEGWFRRVGEHRRPVVWCATPEVPAVAS
jgi:hypothetical protein